MGKQVRQMETSKNFGGLQVLKVVDQIPWVGPTRRLKCCISAASQVEPVLPQTGQFQR